MKRIAVGIALVTALLVGVLAAGLPASASTHHKANASAHTVRGARGPRGPRGARGLKGATGAQGPNGADNTYFAATDFENPSTAGVYYGSVSCPAGYIVVSGGVAIDPSDTDYDTGEAFTVDSGPASTTSWGADAHVEATGDDFVVYAICQVGTVASTPRSLPRDFRATSFKMATRVR